MEYVTIHKSESHGSNGAFGIEIRVAASKLPDLKQTEIWSATRRAAENIEAVVCAAIKADDPKTAIQTTDNRKLVDDLFFSPIFVEEIGNGYCKDWCCAHLPWFIVTTEIGRFTIGWRKRVISIDWSETVGTKNPAELFSDEDVTKGTKSIHAWSVEDARRYVDSIMLSVSK